MGFVDLKKLEEKYATGFMKDNVENLIDFEAYHCLLKGGMSAVLKMQNSLGTVPKQYLDWVRLCDGGLLFDTVLLSTQARDTTLDLEFDTYDEMNSDEAKAHFGLPEGFVIFAFWNYEELFCFNVKENDGKVYLWDVQTGEFGEIWDSFEDWITEEIDHGVRMIADDVLEPLGIKVGGDDDE